MITHEQYLEYKKLVDEYEQAEYERNQRNADDELSDDYDDDLDQDDYEDSREQELAERAFNCQCGAWCFNSDKTKVLHVADCICGAE